MSQSLMGVNVVVGKERCPECAKKGKDTRGDNLVRFGDGHAHCWACNYHIFSNTYQQLEAIVKNAVEAPKETKVLTIPVDAEKTIDAKGLQWLDKYGIMREEIIEHDIRWSKLREALLFPYRVAGMLEAYQWRFFKTPAIKWYTQGNVDSLLYTIGFTRHPEGPIVVVEDIVSAIKVSRHCRAMPLLGSYLSLRRLLRLRHICDSILFWLDSDKYVEAMDPVKRAANINIKAQVLYTPKDPKDYSDDQIINYLREVKTNE